MPILTPHVPNGLIDLMKNLAKEVLRDKPENIYEFAAVHLENLIKQRDGSLNKGYEEFVAFEAHFDGQQRFAVPANSGYKCQRPIKIQPMPQSRKSKSDIMASFQAMESINEEDVLLAGETPYTDEKYQKAIYVIQRYFRRYMAKKKNLPSSTSLSASTAAVIIQRTMRSLFSNKKKFKTTEKDSTTATAVAAVKLNQDDVDNVSEAASYTSSSTIQMLADGQEGRENRLPSGEGQRLQREEVLEDGGADLSSLEFKEQSQDEPSPRPPPPQPVAVVDDDEEHSHSHSHSGVVEEAATEMDRKSISDENGNFESTPQEAHHPTSESTTDDTSTAHIGLLSTKIDSNDHQNSPYTNIVDIDRNRSQPTHTNTKSYVVAAAVASATAAVVTSVPLNYPQSLGATPDTLPATSPNLERTQETFAINLLDNGIGKNNDASVLHGSGRIRKFDPDTGEALKIYDVFYQNINDPEFSDSLNESTMEKDSLEPEELDVDSLESNENMTHVSGLVKRETVVKQDDGSLYGDADNDVEEKEVDGEQNGQKFTELERVPTYLYGIHPARTPVPERKAKIRNSSESDGMPLEVKQSDEVVGVEMRSKTPEEKSEEASLESKCSTSEESSATQIENNLAHSGPEELSSAIEKAPDYKDPSKNIHLIGDSALKNGQSISKAPETQALKSETETSEQKQSDIEIEGDDSGLTVEINSGQLAVHSSKDNLSSEEHSPKEEKSEKERITNIQNVNQVTDSLKAASAKLIDSERKSFPDGNSPQGKVLSNQMKPHGDITVLPEQETYQVDDALSIPEGEIVKERKENGVSEKNSHKSSEDGIIAFKNQTQNQFEEPSNTFLSSAQSKDLKNTEFNNQLALEEKNELSSAMTDDSSLSKETMNAIDSRVNNMPSNEAKDNLKNSRGVVLEDLSSVSEKDIQSESISEEFGTGNDETNAASTRRKRSLGMSQELEEGASANDDLLGNLGKQVSSSNKNEEKNSTVDSKAPTSNKFVEENFRTSDENLNIAEETSRDQNENVEPKKKNAEPLKDSNASEEIVDKKGSNQQNSLSVNTRTTAEENFSDSAASQFWLHDEAIESQLQELLSLNDGVSGLEEQNHETRLLSEDTRSDEVIHPNAHTSEVLVNGEEVKSGSDEISKTIINIEKVEEHPIDKKDSTTTKSVRVSCSQEGEKEGVVSSSNANVNAMNSEEASEKTTKVIQAADSSNPGIAEEVFDQSTNLGVVGSGALVGLHAYAISSLDSNDDKKNTEDSNKSLSLKTDEGDRDEIEQKFHQKTDNSNLTAADALKNSSSGEGGVTKLASQSFLREDQEINKNLKPSSLENTIETDSTGGSQIGEAGNANQSSKKSSSSTEEDNSASDKDKHKIEKSHDGNCHNKEVLNEETNSISGLIDGEAMMSGTSGNEESVIRKSASRKNLSINPELNSSGIDDDNKNLNGQDEASQLMGKLSSQEKSGRISTARNDQFLEPDVLSADQLEANFDIGDLITKKHLGEDDLEKSEGEKALSAIEEVKKQTNGALISNEDAEIDNAMEKDPKILQEVVESRGTKQESKISTFEIDSKDHQSTEAEKMERLGAGDSELNEPGLKKETKTTDVTRIQDSSGSDGKDITSTTKLEKGNQEESVVVVVQKNAQSHEDLAESREGKEKKDKEATVKVETDRSIVKASHLHSASLQSPTEEGHLSEEESARNNDFTLANSPHGSHEETQETQDIEIKGDEKALNSGTVVLEKVDEKKGFSEVTRDKSDESEKEAKLFESSTTVQVTKEVSKSNPKTEGAQENSDRVYNSKEFKEKSNESKEEPSAAVETQLSTLTDENVEKKIPDSEVKQITEDDIKKQDKTEATSRKLQDTVDSKSDLTDKDTDEKGDRDRSSKASKRNRDESEEDHLPAVEIERPVPTPSEKDREKEKSHSEVEQLPEEDIKKKLSSTETEATTANLQDTEKDSKSDKKAKDSDDKGDRVCSSKAFKAKSDKSNADPSAAVQAELPLSTDKGEEKKIPDSEVKQIFDEDIKKKENVHETEGTARKLQDTKDSKSYLKDKNTIKTDDDACSSKAAKEKPDESKEGPSTAVETELPPFTVKVEEKKIPDSEVKQTSEDDIKKEESFNETEATSRKLQNTEDSKSECKAQDFDEKGGHVSSSKVSKGNPDESEEGHFPAVEKELPAPISTEKDIEKEAPNSEVGQLPEEIIKNIENPNETEATARKVQDTEDDIKSNQKPKGSDDKTERAYSSKAVIEKFDQSKEDPSAAVEREFPSSTDKAEEKKISDSEIGQLSTEVIKEEHNPTEDITQGDKMVQENPEKVTGLESTELMSHEGSSADTSADFSSIGKDLEFFEDTIKYLKEATEHLGAMDEAFEEKKGSIPTPKITEDLSQSAVVIQSAFRGYQARKQLKASNHKDGGIGEIINVEDRNNRRAASTQAATESRNNALQRETKVDSEANLKSAEMKDKAASKIQSTYRGFRQRKAIKEGECVVQRTNSETDDVQTNAATKIQSTYRGHRVRRSLKDLNSRKQIENPEVEKPVGTPIKNSFEGSPEKSPIPVAVIHPTKYPSQSSSVDSISTRRTTHMNVNRSNAAVSVTKSNKRASSVNESTTKRIATSSTRPIKSDQNSPTKVASSHSSQRTVSLSRQRPLEKKSRVGKNYSLDGNNVASSVKAPEKLIDNLDKTVKGGQISAQKLATISSSGYNRKPLTVKSKTPSTDDSIERPRESVRELFERKRKSSSTSANDKTQTSFDVEVIRQELLSTKVKIPSQSGRKKKVNSGGSHPVGNGSLTKQPKGTKILQKSSSTTSDESKSLDKVEQPSEDLEVRPCEVANVEEQSAQNHDNSTLSAGPRTPDQVPTVQAKEERKSLSKTYTIRSSLNEMADSDRQSNKVTKEVLGDIDLESPPDLFEKPEHDVNTQEASATTIQKTFRGYRVRRSLRNTKSQENSTTGTEKTSKTSTESSIPREMKTKNPSENQANQQEGELKSEERKGVSATTEERDLNEPKKAILTSSNNDVKEQTESVPHLPIQSEDSKNLALEKSATTIQKTYRGYRSRKDLESQRAEKAIKSKDSSGLESAFVKDLDESHPMSQEPQEIKDIFKQRNEESGTMDIFESLKKDFEDYKATALDKSATTIQKHFRGYNTRKGLKSKRSKEHTESETSDSTDQLDKKTRGNDDKLGEISESKKNDNKLENSDTVLNLSVSKDSQRSVKDPTNDLDNSATTIQKTFRGYITRKHLQNGDKSKKVPENRDQPVEEILKVKTGDKKVLQEDQKETLAIEDSDKSKEGINVEEDPGVFDSFDVEEFHNQALQKSATTIQKTFRGYQTRKELLTRNDHLKTIEECPEIKQSDPMANEAATTIQSSYRGYSSRKAKPQNSTNKPSSIPVRVSNKSLPDGKEIENKVQVSSNKESETVSTSPEVSADQSGILTNAAKTASAGAVLENAASTIQKAYRHYHANKTSSSTNSPNSHGIQRETTPKEVVENSDESSIFIGPDTSFDLSDVDSVETRSDKIGLNSDKLSSSEAPTPVYDEGEDPESTITIKIHSEDKEVENDAENTPEKLRRKRSIMDPTAPPLEDIHHETEPTITTSADQKPKWFVGDDLIIPSEDGSAKPSSLPNPLVSPPAPSRFDELSSIDEYRENSNSSSNQQLKPSIESAVVSTSSLLLANITEMHGKNNLNKPSETVSANEEEEENLNLESEAKRLEEIDGANGELNDKGVALNDMKLRRAKNTDIGSKDLDEDKEGDEKKDTLTELCKNCADGIHEGGPCTTESMKETTQEKSTKEGQTHPDSPDKHVDQIKEFVLMEESNSSTSTSVNKEQDTKSSNVESKQKADEPESSATASNESKSSKLKMKENESGNRDSVHETTTQTLKPNDCPAISLIPPSSEDDTSGGETSHEPVQKNVGDNEETTPELVADTKIVDEKTETKKETPESMKTNFKSDGETEDFKETYKEELSTNEHNANISDEAVRNNEEANRTPEMNEDSHLTETENGSKNQTDKEVKDVAGSKDSAEDAFKTQPGEELTVTDTHFEDDFSDSENISNDLIKKPADENQMSDNSMAQGQQSHDHEAITSGGFLQEGAEHAPNTVDESEKGGSQEEIKSLKLEGVSSDVATANNVKPGDENSRSNLQENEEKKLNGSKDTSEEGSLITKSLSSSEGQDQKVDPEIAETKKEESNEELKSNSENTIIDEEKTKTTSDEKLVITKNVSEEASTPEEGKGDKSFDSKEDDKPSQEDIEIASELIARSLSLEEKQKSSDTGNKLQTENVVEDSSPKNDTDPEASYSTETMKEQKSTSDSNVISHVEKLIEDNLKLSEDAANTVGLKDLPTKDSSQEVDEVPCVKVEVLPRTPISVSSDPDESELESTTTKAESTTTTPGYDDGSENDVVEIPASKPDELDAMTEKLRETEAMVARMRQRRASEQRISIDSVSDQPVAAFEEPICDPIKPMQRLQKSSSTEVEDEFVLQKLQRGDTTRESSAQSESVIFGETSSHLTETDDTFNENMDLHALHRANTITSNRDSAKPTGHLYKSVTIDDTVKYIDPEKSTEESAGSFSMDDTMSEDVRKKMMAYSVSEADSDYYDLGDQTSRPHDDFNISTALDNFPSSDTDTTIVSAATKIQAGARGFLTRRRIRRASMGTKASMNEERKTSFGNDAIGESLDQLAEEENNKRQYNRQTGVSSLPSAMSHLDEINHSASSLGEAIHTPMTPSTKHSSIDNEFEKPSVSTPTVHDINVEISEFSDDDDDDDSPQTASYLEATLARRLTLQRGDAMRNDSTPDDENGGGNGKQVDLAKKNSSSIGNMLIHEKTMIESTTTTTTRTTTERRNYSDADATTKRNEIKWFAMRQNSMPVQIDSEVFRVLPKHMRKRIKSAEGEKPKRIRLPKD